MTLNKSITDQELFRYLFWGVRMLNLTRHHASWRKGPYFRSAPAAERTVPQGCEDRWLSCWEPTLAEMPTLEETHLPLWHQRVRRGGIAFRKIEGKGLFAVDEASPACVQLFCPTCELMWRQGRSHWSAQEGQNAHNLQETPR